MPQRFRQRGSPRLRARVGRQEAAAGGYLAPAIDSYVTPAAAEPAAAEALYSAPEEVAASETAETSYLAPVAAAAELDNAYAAPAESDASYLAPAQYDDAEYAAEEEEYVAEYAEEAAADSSYLAPAAAEEVPVYEAEEELGGYEDDLSSAASDAAAEADPLKMLMNAVPGVPGEDYPIYATPPDTRC